MFASYQHEEPVPTSFWLEAPVPTVIPTCIICVHLCPTESTHAYRFLPTHTHWSPTGITRAHLFSAGSTHAHWSPTGITRAHLFSAGSIHAHWSPTGITRAHLFSEEGTRAHHLFEQESLMPVSFPPETLVSTVLFLSFFFSTGSTRANKLLTGITHAFSFQQEAFAPTIFFQQEAPMPSGFLQELFSAGSNRAHHFLLFYFSAEITHACCLHRKHSCPPVSLRKHL